LLNRGRLLQLTECWSSIMRRHSEITVDETNDAKRMTMNANMALTSLQSVEKYGFWGRAPKYLALKVVQVAVPSHAQTPIKLLQAAMNKRSKMVAIRKKRGPSKTMGRSVTLA